MGKHDGYVDVSSFNGNNSNGPNKKHKKMSTGVKVLIIVLSIFVVLAISLFYAFHYYFGGINVDNSLPTTDSALGIVSSAPNKNDNADKKIEGDGITNIALYGIDSRTHDGHGHADATMVLSINRKENRLKLISILRDTEVEIEGRGKAKITTSYWWGGPEMALKTLNQNFHLNVRDYVTVNFDQLARVIDSVGGVNIKVTPIEQREINHNLKDVNKTYKLLNKNGNVTLDGKQATAYARIRYIDSDACRAGRQQKVLAALLEKVKKMDITAYPEFIRNLTKNNSIRTSLDYGEMCSYIPVIASKPSLETYTIPGKQEHAIGHNDGSAWVWSYDLNKAAEHIHNIIYNDAD